VAIPKKIRRVSGFNSCNWKGREEAQLQATRKVAEPAIILGIELRTGVEASQTRRTPENGQNSPNTGEKKGNQAAKKGAKTLGEKAEHGR